MNEEQKPPVKYTSHEELKESLKGATFDPDELQKRITFSTDDTKESTQATLSDNDLLAKIKDHPSNCLCGYCIEAYDIRKLRMY